MLKQKNFSLLLEKDANEALRRTFVAEHVLLVLIESKNFSKKLFCSEKNGLNKKFFFRSFLAEMFCSVTLPLPQLHPPRKFFHQVNFHTPGHLFEKVLSDRGEGGKVTMQSR